MMQLHEHIVWIFAKNFTLNISYELISKRKKKIKFSIFWKKKNFSSFLLLPFPLPLINETVRITLSWRTKKSMSWTPKVESLLFNYDWYGNFLFFHFISFILALFFLPIHLLVSVLVYIEQLMKKNLKLNCVFIA